MEGASGLAKRCARLCHIVGCSELVVKNGTVHGSTDGSLRMMKKQDKLAPGELAEQLYTAALIAERLLCLKQISLKCK